MSHGNSPFTTISALKAGDALLGPDREWKGVTTVQDDWLARHYRENASRVSQIPEIASHATGVAAEHVAFLARHGWEAQIRECAPGAVLMASVLDVLVTWKHPGTKTQLTRAGATYDAALLKRGVDAFRTADYDDVARIETDSGDRVWLAVPKGPPPRDTALTDVAGNLIAARKAQVHVEELQFPMIDFADTRENDWMIGLHTVRENGTPCGVERAVQQLTLKMNHLKARARAADEISARCLSIPKRLVIDRPFLFILERPSLPQPFFAAYLTEECWRDPGDF